MNTNNFKAINLALHLNAAAILLLIVFTWAAPVLMAPSYPKAEISTLCSQTRGCRKIAVTSQWNPEKSRYQPTVHVQFNSMSESDKNNLMNEVRRAFENAAGRNPVFGYRFKNVAVMFNYAK